MISCFSAIHGSRGVFMWMMMAARARTSIRCCGALRRLATLNENGVVEVGQTLSMCRTFTQADVLAFADITGDHNPIHSDKAAARAAGFEKPLCHGMLYSTLPGTLFARAVPGAVYVSQTLNFKRPVLVDEEVEVVIQVEQVRRRFCTFATRVLKRGDDGEKAVVMQGTAVTRLPALPTATEGGSTS